MRGTSALELLEARLAHPYWLFGGRRESVPRRTLRTENVSTMSAVVLDIHRGEIQDRQSIMRYYAVKAEMHFKGLKAVEMIKR